MKSEPENKMRKAAENKGAAKPKEPVSGRIMEPEIRRSHGRHGAGKRG